MAIRPTDLNLGIIQGVQSAPIAQRAEENPRVAQAASQAAFVAETEERNETVVETGNMQGNRVEANEHQQEGQERQPKRRRRHLPGTPFDEQEADAAASGEPPHLIDFT